MLNPPIRVMLADDDPDDCLFFNDAVQDLPLEITVTIAYDGVELMKALNIPDVSLPDIIFLDLNMPRKGGFDCLDEIKANAGLEQLVVIIFSTSFDRVMVDTAFNKRAYAYVHKPTEFSTLKNVIQKALSLVGNRKEEQLPKNNFVIQV